MQGFISARLKKKWKLEYSDKTLIHWYENNTLSGMNEPIWKLSPWRMLKKGIYQTNSLSEKDSFSSSLWFALFARHSTLLCPSWRKAFHTWFYCIFQSTPQSTWHPNGHTIFVAFPWVLALFRVLEYQELHLRTVPWRVGLRQLTQNNLRCFFAGEACCLPVIEDTEIQYINAL